MGVDVGEREVAEDVAEGVAVLGQELADDRLGPPAVRALEVGVLDERDRGVVVSADVIALGVDVVGQVDELLGGARRAGASGRPTASGR